MNDLTPDPFAPAEIGDNNPPIDLGNLPSVDEIIAMLEVNYSDVLTRSRDILAKAPEHFTITTDAQDSAATEFLVILRTNLETAEAGRVKEKAPYYDRDGAIHAWFKTNILDLVGEAGASINAASTAYKKAKVEAERKRLEAEAAERRKTQAEAERVRLAAVEAALKAQRELAEAQAAAARKRNAETKAAAEAEVAELKRKNDEAEAARRAAEDAENKAAQERAEAEKAANAKAADLSRSRGGRGGVSSLKEFVNFRDLKRDSLDLNMLAPYFKDEHLEMAVRAYAKANKATVETHLRNRTQPIKGVTFFMDEKNAGRA